jgi:hypothetical protein
MSLISQNTYSCTGDKAGSGDALAFYGSDTAAFNVPKAVAVSTANSVTVSTADGVDLLLYQHNVPVPVASYYRNYWIQIVNGAGLGQARKISSYVIDASAQKITFVVSPNWDVAPDTSSVLVVGRALWQVHTVDNNIDNIGCTKANQNGIKSQGGITLSGQATDFVIEGNLQRESAGINLAPGYSIPFTASGHNFPPFQQFQSFLDVQRNRILQEFDYDSRCSTGGVGLSCVAATGPDLSTLPASPVVPAYGLTFARNEISHADALRGGGLSFAATWVVPNVPKSRLYLNTLIHHNAFSDLAPPASEGTTTTSQCAGEGTMNCGDVPVREGMPRPLLNIA